MARGQILYRDRTLSRENTFICHFSAKIFYRPPPKGQRAKTQHAFTFAAFSFPGDIRNVPGRPSHPMSHGWNVFDIDDLPYVLVLGTVVGEEEHGRGFVQLPVVRLNMVVRISLHSEQIILETIGNAS